MSIRPNESLRGTTLSHARSGKDFDATSQARELEDRAFREASSQEDYQSRCKEINQQFLPMDDMEDDLPNPSDEDETNHPVTTIDPYRDARFHKDGLFSTIYKASSTNANQEFTGSQLVALKVTTPSMMIPPHDSIREARLLNQAHSPNVIPLLTTLENHPNHFTLILPFCPYDLSTLLTRHPRSLTPPLKHSILHALFSALSHIHALGIIHRDIKPSNILLRTISPSGPIYLSDFGIAWSPSDPSSEPPHQKLTDIGTAHYRPPEILFGCTTYDATLDMWAAGCLVSELFHPQHTPLFSSGPVGSELALIKSIFETLGTPNEETWPSTTVEGKLPDWGKMAFRNYPAKPWRTILPGVKEEEALDLVSGLVRYEMSQRMGAEQALAVVERMASTNAGEKSG